MMQVICSLKGIQNNVLITEDVRVCMADPLNQEKQHHHISRLVQTTVLTHMQS